MRHMSNIYLIYHMGHSCNKTLSTCLVPFLLLVFADFSPLRHFS